MTAYSCLCWGGNVSADLNTDAVINNAFTEASCKLIIKKKSLKEQWVIKFHLVNGQILNANIALKNNILISNSYRFDFGFTLSHSSSHDFNVHILM